jgi:hypothetical protein
VLSLHIHHPFVADLGTEQPQYLHLLVDNMLTRHTHVPRQLPMTSLGNDHTSPPNLSLETVCKLLADGQRRTTVQYFIDNETDVAELDEVVYYVREEVEEVTTLKQARTDLVHTHFPKLADFGVIEYDSRSETVRYQDGSFLEAVLEVAAVYEQSD